MPKTHIISCPGVDQINSNLRLAETRWDSLRLAETRMISRLQYVPIGPLECSGALLEKLPLSGTASVH